ncbi:MAG TPA: hypothetical protein VKZ72_00345 [Acidimicrobiales bacterium]|nr:hypothetical protein [Acidimicrobiales bacterium]
MTVRTRVEGWSGVVAGVTFVDGQAEVDETEHPAAVRYFRQAGYHIEPVPTRRRARKAADTGGEADAD